ncbi:HU family DNA-binding protein [Kitasatospora sp. NPDC017646]|uniref:HU family DNA-binding protein n=1 Tax=Kitasatospora sp. NPDC017646 TaxID=3364024 RepID=UPI0037AF7084
MRKSDLIAVIAERTGLTKEKAQQVHDAITDSIAATLKTEEVTLVGFGTFEVRHRAARMGKNPQTGESVAIAASNTVAFKAGKNLRDGVNAPARASRKEK